VDIEETDKGNARAAKEGKVCGDDKVVAGTARSGTANILGRRGLYGYSCSPTMVGRIKFAE